MQWLWMTVGILIILVLILALLLQMRINRKNAKEYKKALADAKKAQSLGYPVTAQYISKLNDLLNQKP